MECETDDKVSCIRKMPCNRGKSRYKLFYCSARDLGDYVRQLNAGKISKHIIIEFLKLLVNGVNLKIIIWIFPFYILKHKHRF